MTLSKITLAAAITLATAIVVSVPFVTRAQNPAASAVPSSVGPTAVTVPAGKPRSAAAEAALASLNTLQLSQPFTLKYTAVTKDVSTPAMWAVETNMVKHSYEVMAERGDITQAVAEQQIKIRGAGKTAQTPLSPFDVTLSFDGSRLFYQKTEPEKHLLTVIYDGKKTYRYEAYSYEHSGHSMTVYPGLKFGEMFSCPIPGVGLPQVPLLRDSSALASQGLLVKGDVLSTGVGGDPLYYKRGAIALTNKNGNKEVAAMTLFYFERNFPEERWEFPAHRPFQKIPIASEIRYTRYAPAESTPVDAPNTKPWPPEWITEYHLQSASDAPVDAGEFDPTHLMAPGDHVYDNTVQGSSAYRWKAGGGF